MANLNTNSAVRDEGNWDYLGWSPRITSSGAMDTFVGTLATRANAVLQQRVGVAWYAANKSTAPYDEILKAAEMHLAQAYLLEAAAQVAETGLDTNPAPFLGGAKEIRDAAQRRLDDFEGMVALTRSTSRPAGKVPYVTVVATSGAVLTRFDHTTGDTTP